MKGRHCSIASALLVLVILMAGALVVQAGMGTIALNTFGLVCAVVGLSVLLGTPLAFALVRVRIGGGRLAIVLVGSLLLVPLYLQAAAWQAVWGVQGWLTNLFGMGPLEGWLATIWIHTAAAIPWVVLIVGLGLRKVEPELEEDALLDGSPGAVFWNVTLRRSLPAIGAAAIWVAASVAGEMTVTDLYQIRTLAEVTYLQYAATADAEEATRGLLLGTVALASLLGASIAIVAGKLSLDRHASPRLSSTFSLGRSQRWVSLLTWMALMLLVGVPLVGLVHKAGIVVTRTADGWERSWSLGSAMRMTATSLLKWERGESLQVSPELKWSAVIAAAAATAATMIGLLLAWIARGSRLRIGLAIVIVATALVIPGPVAGVALIECFQVSDARWLAYLYDRTILAPAIAQSLRALPLAALILWQAVAAVPRELLDSARVDGAGRCSILCCVVLPLIRRSLLVAWLVAFAVAMGDLAASILVLPPGINTLANHIFGLIHYGVDDQVAGIALAMMGGFVMIGVAIVRLARGRIE